MLTPLAQTANLRGARVLVTGGTQGIGAAVAARFVEAGADVVVAARREPRPGPGRFLAADLSSEDGARSLAERTLALLGGLDVLVSNAGGQLVSPDGPLRLTEDDWQSDLSLNLLSAVRLDRALVPGMVDQGSGVVVHVGSHAGRWPQPQALAYAAAKAGLSSYSKGLATSVAPHGVRVHTVLPGIIRGARLEDALEQRAAAAGTDVEAEAVAFAREWKIPLGRPGTADDVALLVLFLASPAARYLTGTQYGVDGGVLPTL